LFVCLFACLLACLLACLSVNYLIDHETQLYETRFVCGCFMTADSRMRSVTWSCRRALFPEDG